MINAYFCDIIFFVEPFATITGFNELTGLFYAKNIIAVFAFT